MGRAAKAITVAVVIGLAAFFFAPAIYWCSITPTFDTQNPSHWNVYRSLGCMTVGLGDTYSVQGLQLTCSPPVI